MYINFENNVKNLNSRQPSDTQICLRVIRKNSWSNARGSPEFLARFKACNFDCNVVYSSLSRRKMPSAFFLTFLPLLNRLFQAPEPSSFSLTFSRSLRRALTITVALLDVSQESPLTRSFSLKFLPLEYSAAEDADKPLSQMTVSAEHKAI